MKLRSDYEIRFWKKVFLAAIKAGKWGKAAVHEADDAVMEYRSRI